MTPTTISHGCIEFTGYRNRKGYGKKGRNGKVHLAHRLAYEDAFGRNANSGTFGIRAVKGTDHPRAKLTPTDVAELRRLAGTASYRALGDRFGISAAQAHKIIKGGSWV